MPTQVPSFLQGDPRKPAVLDLQNLPASLINSEEYTPDPAKAWPGMPPNSGEFVTEQIHTVSGYVGTFNKVLPNEDEATRTNPQNAQKMETACDIWECVEARQRAIALLPWHLESDEPADPKQRELCAQLTKVIERGHDQTEMRRNVQDAIWYGRSLVQIKYGVERFGQRWLKYAKYWQPRHPDKLVFRYDDGTRQWEDGQVGIRVSAAHRDQYPDRVDPTQYGHVRFLKEYERNTCIIHKHMIGDSPFNDPYGMGRIHGFGIRDRIYWTWFQQQCAMVWLMSFLERTALGIELWYFPSGNPEAETMMRRAATERVNAGGGRTIMLIPVIPGEDSQNYTMQHIEPGLGGAELIKDICGNFFGHKIKRYVLGQTMTSEVDSAGIGSEGVAAAHMMTFSDIVQYDARKHQETLTRDYVRRLQIENWPEMSGVYVRWVCDVGAPESEKILGGFQSAFAMGTGIPVAAVYKALNISKPDKDDPVLTNPQIQMAQLQLEQARQQAAQQQQMMAQQAAGGQPGQPGGVGPGGVPGQSPNQGMISAQSNTDQGQPQDGGGQGGADGAAQLPPQLQEAAGGEVATGRGGPEPAPTAALSRVRYADGPVFAKCPCPGGAEGGKCACWSFGEGRLSAVVDQAKAIDQNTPVGYLGNIGGFQAYAVNFDQVKTGKTMDAVEGGNFMVYPKFVPQGQIWVDSNIAAHDRPFILAHEAIETRLMHDHGWKYDHAHTVANRVELAMRLRAAYEGQDEEPEAEQSGGIGRTVFLEHLKEKLGTKPVNVAVALPLIWAMTASAQKAQGEQAEPVQDLKGELLAEFNRQSFEKALAETLGVDQFRALGLDSAEVEFYAKKFAKGQGMLWGAEQEEQHPREAAGSVGPHHGGEFAKKEEAATVVEKPAVESQPEDNPEADGVEISDEQRKAYQSYVEWVSQTKGITPRPIEVWVEHKYGVKLRKTEPKVEPAPEATPDVDSAKPDVAESPDGGFNEFRKKYQDLFGRMMKYGPNEVGAGHYADQMAKLADEHPDWVERIEAEGAPVNEKHVPPAPELPEIDDSEAPEVDDPEPDVPSHSEPVRQDIVDATPNQLGEMVADGDEAAAKELAERIDEKFPESSDAPKAKRARSVRKKLVEDFGEKIVARKDTAEKTGPKKPKADKPEDLRPGWARRYSVGQIVKSRRPEEEGKWSIHDERKKDDWTGQPQQATRELFDSKEAAEAAIPMIEVSRNHDVYEVRRKPESEDAAASVKRADTWLNEQRKELFQIDQEHGTLLSRAEFRDKLVDGKRTGRVSEDQFKKLVDNGTLMSDEEYAEADKIRQKVQAIKDRPMPDGSKPAEKEFQIRRKVGERKRPIVKGGFASREEAMKYMAEHPEEIIEHEFPRYETYQYLDRVERHGGPQRKGDINPKDFQNVFGFAGGVFGNWQSGKDGQTVLNHAYDALHDLADAIGVKPSALSLNGKLGISFGALGTGGKDAARAHYEHHDKPEMQGVINMTKMHGAGTLAHEWAHAMDHYFAKQAVRPEDQARTGRYSHVTEGLPYQHALRPEVAEAWTGLVGTMFAKESTKGVDADLSKKQAAHNWEHVDTRIKSLETSIAGDKQYNKRHKDLTEAQQKEWDEAKAKIMAGDPGKKMTVASEKSRFGGYDTYEHLDKLNKLYKAATGRSFHTAADESIGKDLFWSVNRSIEADKKVKAASSGATETKKGPTEYLREARKLDETKAKDYYTVPTEMLARAFEAYAHDKLAEKERKSDYLTGKADNKFYRMFDMAPFPEGEERTAINAAFDKLFGAIQHEPRSDDKGEHVRMYQQDGTPERYAMSSAEIDDACQGWEEPTEAQKEAGNAPVVRVPYRGETISIETPKGFPRREGWPPVAAHYGKILKTKGADGEHVDCFLANDVDNSNLVYIIDQEHPSGRWDEHKVILNVASPEAAKRIYESSYTPGWHVGPVTEMTWDGFRNWLHAGDTTRRVADQVSRYSLSADEALELYQAGSLSAEQYEQAAFMASCA